MQQAVNGGTPRRGLVVRSVEFRRCESECCAGGVSPWCSARWLLLGQRQGYSQVIPAAAVYHAIKLGILAHKLIERMIQ